MPENQITFRTDPRFKARIAELVEQKEYKNLSEFMNEAIMLKFEADGVEIKGGFPRSKPLVSFFESPRGRALLRELLREARES